MKALIVSDREFDTILAALRHWQEGLTREDRQPPSAELIEMAENGRNGGDASLLAGEIDELCERINLDPGHVVVALWENAEGVSVSTFATVDDAEAWRRDIAAEWWRDEMHGEPMPEDPEDAADAYFDAMAERGDRAESFRVECCAIESDEESA